MKQESAAPKLWGQLSTFHTSLALLCFLKLKISLSTFYLLLLHFTSALCRIFLGNNLFPIWNLVLWEITQSRSNTTGKYEGTSKRHTMPASQCFPHSNGGAEQIPSTCIIFHDQDGIFSTYLDRFPRNSMHVFITGKSESAVLADSGISQINARLKPWK